MVGLLIVGAGGHGKVVADLVQASGHWSHLSFLDDTYPKPDQVGPWQVVGRTGDSCFFLERHPAAIIAIGNNQLRMEMQKRLEEEGFRFPTLVHPHASVSSFCDIGAGSVVCTQAAVVIGAQIGVGSIINTGASVGHDCRLADGVHVAPGARLAGGVSVGEGSWIGIGATIREGVAIGRRVVVGAGSTILQDVPDGVTIVGSPGRIIHGEALERTLIPSMRTNL